jgi:hypothetical protein
MQRLSFLRRHFVGPGLAAVVVCATLLLMGGCDPAVELVKPSSQYQFSLFGTLNVAADTQVIRVEPIGDTTQIGAPTTLDATARLTNLDTGTEVALNDSLTVVGGGIAQVHNFWTTHAIQPGATYQVSVRVDGEPVTTATTTTPAQPPTLLHNPDATSDQPFELPCVYDSQGNPTSFRNTFSMRIANLDAVAAMQVRYPLDLPTSAGETAALTQFSHYNDVEYDEEEDLYRASVFYGRDLATIPGASQQGACPPRSQFTEAHAVAVVTAGGPDWPDWKNASLNTIARPDTFTNVQGGHGFVGGIYSDTLRVPLRNRD